MKDKKNIECFQMSEKLQVWVLSISELEITSFSKTTLLQRSSFSKCFIQLSIARYQVALMLSSEDDQSILIETFEFKPTILFRTTPTHLEITNFTISFHHAKFKILLMLTIILSVLDL